MLKSCSHRGLIHHRAAFPLSAPERIACLASSNIPPQRHHQMWPAKCVIRYRESCAVPADRGPVFVRARLGIMSLSAIHHDMSVQRE